MNFESVKVAVIGDVILDIYVKGDVKSISPEALVPVINKTGHSYVLGGAANVAANLAGLGCNVSLVSIIGNDTFKGKIDHLS